MVPASEVIGPMFELEGNKVFQRPIEVTKEDGAKFMKMGFLVCTVDDWINDPQIVVNLLNAGHEALNKGDVDGQVNQGDD